MRSQGVDAALSCGAVSFIQDVSARGQGRSLQRRGRSAGPRRALYACLHFVVENSTRNRVMVELS